MKDINVSVLIASKNNVVVGFIQKLLVLTGIPQRSIYLATNTSAAKKAMRIPSDILYVDGDFNGKNQGTEWVKAMLEEKLLEETRIIILVAEINRASTKFTHPQVRYLTKPKPEVIVRKKIEVATKSTQNSAASTATA